MQTRRFCDYSEYTEYFAATERDTGMTTSASSCFADFSVLVQVNGGIY